MNLNVQVKQAGKKVNKIKTVVMEIKEPPKTVEELLIAAVKQTRELFVQKRKKSEKLEQGDLSQVSLTTRNRSKTWQAWAKSSSVSR